MAGLKLHIGCKGERIPGFKRLDLVDWGDVDYIQNADNLSNFESGSVDEIYVSNILEHFPHVETVKVLKEWRRVLRPGGIAWISVPDLDASIKIYQLEPTAPWPIYLLYGDQAAPLHYHYINFNYAMLARDLVAAGFSDVKRINSLPYGLKDASTYSDNIYKIPISLNVKAIA